MLISQEACYSVNIYSIFKKIIIYIYYSPWSLGLKRIVIFAFKYFVMATDQIKCFVIVTSTHKLIAFCVDFLHVMQCNWLETNIWISKIVFKYLRNICKYKYLPNIRIFVWALNLCMLARDNNYNSLSSDICQAK